MASITLSGSRSTTPTAAAKVGAGPRALFAGSRTAEQAVPAYVRPSRAASSVHHLQSGSSRATGDRSNCTHLTEHSELRCSRRSVPEPRDGVVPTDAFGDSEGPNF